MTLKGAIREAREIYIFAVVRWADDSSDSAHGYVAITRTELMYQLKQGFLQGKEPSWTFDPKGCVLSIG